MAKIQINDVKLGDTELLNDAETFLNELENGEMEQVIGGKTISLDDYEFYKNKKFDFPKRLHPIKPIDFPEPNLPKLPKHPGVIKIPYEPVIL
ncbi:hypothetical protein Riv7116_0197 [Rivularia sp. PCC 7116]|uniref:hypothetical protein n=1 Tax=Rivularia sp. PCC 7116 TaxID=373994 RepID=UPI00029F01FB|nr:hypothetical protein [Rivularia sp. PCC 7116]AFY52805.1 hypothetical protein Riv7116_0197 [Rivularia sp. PCC 7116]